MIFEGENMEQLDQFLIKQLEPISEADPQLLSNYVVALLKNNKSQEELKQLCLDQLQDFLGDATEGFVTNLFTALEEGMVKVSNGELGAQPAAGQVAGQEGLPLGQEEASSVQAREEEAAMEAAAASAGIQKAAPRLERVSSRGEGRGEGSGRAQGKETAEKDDGPDGDEEEDEEEDDDDESSDDEDEDRNHKHRRRARSSEGARDGGPRREMRETEDFSRLPGDDRGPGRGLSRPLSDARRGSSARPSQTGRDLLGRQDRRGFGDREHPGNRLGPGPGGRFGSEGGQRGGGQGARGPPPYRDERAGRFDGPNGMVMPRGMNRGGMGDGWGPGPGPNALPDRPFSGPPFPDGQVPLMGPNLGPAPKFFQGRGMARGGMGPGPQPSGQWGVGFRPLEGTGGPLEHGPLGPGAPPGAGLGPRGPPLLGMGLPLGRAPRPGCPDFEERGFCLRGDLCPLEHGADRIVLEDINHLQQLNLALPGRSVGPGNVTPSIPPAPPGRRHRLDREKGLGVDHHPAAEPQVRHLGAKDLAGDVSVGEGVGAEHYDPDQLLWSHDRQRPKRQLSSLRRPPQEGLWDPTNGQPPGVSERLGPGLDLAGPAGAGNRGGTNGEVPTPQNGTGGSSVWARIGPLTEAPGDATGLAADAAAEAPGEGPRGLKRARAGLGSDVAWNGDVEGGAGPRMSQGFGAGPPSGMPPGDGHVQGRGVPSMQGRGRGRGEASGGRGGEGRGGGRWGTAPPEQRAQRTLYVGNLPSDVPNAEAQLHMHFRRFGLVANLRVTANRDKAFVQFARRADAEGALAAPEAVMGNRFITLSWARHDIDNSPEYGPGTAARAKPGLSPGTPGATAVPSGSPGTPGEGPTGSPVARAQSNGSLPPGQVRAAGVGAGTPGGGASGSVAAAAAAAAAQGKQREKLELLRQIQRKKEALLRAQIEQQKRMMQRLAKAKQQGGAAPTEAAAKPEGTEAPDGSPAVKRPRAGEGSHDGPPAPAGNPAERQEGAGTTAATGAPAVPGVEGAEGGPAGAGSAGGGAAGAGLGRGGSPSSLPSPGLTRSPSSGGYQYPSRPGAGGPMRTSGMSPHGRAGPYGSPWGPGRFKLDNRSTVLRVVPPLPPVASEQTALWEHFSQFAELVSIEEEPAEAAESSGSRAEGGGIRIRFAQRAGAEYAMAQAKLMRGAQLQLAWAPPAKPQPRALPGAASPENARENAPGAAGPISSKLGSSNRGPYIYSMVSNAFPAGSGAGAGAGAVGSAAGAPVGDVATEEVVANGSGRESNKGGGASIPQAITQGDVGVNLEEINGKLTGVNGVGEMAPSTDSKDVEGGGGGELAVEERS